MPRNNALEAPTEPTEVTKAKIEAGWLGKAFGTGPNIAMNVMGFILILLSVIILLAYFLNRGEYLDKLIGLFTLVLVYLAGTLTGRKLG